MHLSLEEKFSKGKEDSAHLFEQHKLLMEQLDQEAKLKAELQLKLHKAEGGCCLLVYFVLYFTKFTLLSCQSFTDSLHGSISLSLAVLCNSREVKFLFSLN